jgi:carbon monoxide dehydrogenase subunit G
VKVSVSRRCAAAPDAVWEWISDPHKHIQMLPHNIRDARVLENGDISAVAHAAGHSEPMTVRVTEQDPPRRFVGKRVDGNRKGLSEFVIAPDGDGSVVTINAQLELPRLIAAVASGKVKSSLEEQLANLDRLSA